MLVLLSVIASTVSLLYTMYQVAKDASDYSKQDIQSIRIYLEQIKDNSSQILKELRNKRGLL